MKKKRLQSWRTKHDDFIVRAPRVGSQRYYGARGFDVRFPHSYTNYQQKYFGVARYGSERAALEAARAYRDAVLKRLGDPPRRLARDGRRYQSFRVKLRAGNKSGLNGVSTDGEHWFAWYHPRPGVQKRRSFAVKKYTNDGARMLAIMWRKDMLKKLERKR